MDYWDSSCHQAAAAAAIFPIQVDKFESHCLENSRRNFFANFVISLF